MVFPKALPRSCRSHYKSDDIPPNAISLQYNSVPKMPFLFSPVHSAKVLGYSRNVFSEEPNHQTPRVTVANGNITIDLVLDFCLGLFFTDCS